MVLLALLALAIGAATAFVATSIAENGLIEDSRTSAIRDGELLAQVAFAGAISDGRLGRGDLVAAEAQFSAARPILDLKGVLVWDSAGRLLFSDPARDGSAGSSAPLPAIARAALRTNRGQAVVAKNQGILDVRTAVPFGTKGRRFVAEISLPRPAEASQLDNVREKLYLAVGIGAILLFAALVPLMTWIVQRLPRREDRNRERTLARLDLAMDRDELQLLFQPQFSILPSRVLGVEALVRWRHPERGLLGPAEFVPLLEGSRLLDKFTETVLEQATATCAQWRAEGLELPVAVNISAQALARDSVVDQVARALDDSGLPAAMLTVEVTESGLMSAVEANAARRLAELRELGVTISIDDFGTGYSSLGRLGLLPLDELKIDRSFVAGMGSDQRTLRVVRSIVELGRQLDLRITAEGVETREELEELTRMGCDVVQGFLLAQPMSAHDLQQWLAVGNGGVEVAETEAR